MPLQEPRVVGTEAERFAADPLQACGCGPRNRTNDTPNEAGRGAERLAIPNVHGIYHR
jgi:hypothetical protein